MTPNAERWLADLFQSDKTADDYFTRHPLYTEVAAGVPVRPWWPPLSEVWIEGVRPPSTWPKGGGKAWAEAHVFLQAAHQQYLATRRPG